MITTVTTTELILTKVTKNAFGESVETVLPEGTQITWWMTEPKTTGTGIDMAWTIGLKAWIGDYTQKKSEPEIFLKEVSPEYKVRLFTDVGGFRYPYDKSDKPYVLSMVDDQSRLLVSFLYSNNIFPLDSLEIVGI